MHEVIETNRLVLRPLVETDSTDFAALVNDWDICRMTGTFPFPFPKPSVDGLIDIFLARAATGRDLHWAITHKGQFIGVVGLYNATEGWGLGYWLGRPYWGRGLTTEAVTALARHVASHDLGTVLTAEVFTDNPASRKVLERAGFVPCEGVSEGYSLARDETVPSWKLVFPTSGPSKPLSLDHRMRLEISETCDAQSDFRHCIYASRDALRPLKATS